MVLNAGQAANGGTSRTGVRLTRPGQDGHNDYWRLKKIWNSIVPFSSTDSTKPLVGGWMS